MCSEIIVLKVNNNLLAEEENLSFIQGQINLKELYIGNNTLTHLIKDL